MTAVFIDNGAEIVSETYALRTGIGRKVMEGDEQACRNRAAAIRATTGMQPQLKLVKIIVAEEAMENL